MRILSVFLALVLPLSSFAAITPTELHAKWKPKIEALESSIAAMLSELAALKRDLRNALPAEHHNHEAAITPTELHAKWKPKIEALESSIAAMLSELAALKHDLRNALPAEHHNHEAAITPTELHAKWKPKIEALESSIAAMLSELAALKHDLHEAGGAPVSVTAGTFRGLLTLVGNATSELGALQISVTKSGKVMMTVSLEEGTFRGTGMLDNQKDAMVTLKRKGLADVKVSLHLDDTTSTVSGTLAAAGVNAEFGAGANVYTKKNPTSQAGSYTVLFFPDGANTAASAVPAGIGYGKLTVSATGRGRFVGTLADGTKTSASAMITRGGELTFFNPLYKAKGMLAGKFIFAQNGTPGSESDFSGGFTWTRPQSATAAAFRANLSGVGSRFQKAAKKTRLLNFAESATNAKMTFADRQGGNVYALHGALNTANQFMAREAQGGGSAKFTLSPLTGLISGRYADPATGMLRSFHGVAFQRRNIAAGFHFSSNLDGAFMLVEDVPPEA